MTKLKILTLVLALCLVLPLLVACRGNNEADVHVFYYNYSDTYISSVRTALDDELQRAGISYQDYDGNGSQTTQTEQIRTAVTKGAKAILVNIVNTGSDDAAGEITQLARDAGIPVVFFNREVNDEVVNGYDKCVYVGTRAEEAGILQGELIGEYLVKNFAACDLNNDGEISYILFKGEEGNNEAIYRTKYSVEEANKALAEAGKKPLRFYDKSNPNAYLVDKNGLWSATAANEYMTTALTAYNAAGNNMIELVICNNDGMAEGAISALNAAGYNKGGSSPTIPVFGVDATDAAQNLIKNKQMSGTIKQDAVGMAKALQHLAQNAVTEGRDLLADTGSFTMDEGTRKMRIHYEKYVG
ncbi:MAG: galactose ABC transporter substrate-binding protein [Clostridia bacterium]|nr:galactose ABC transporter substrate-binding protein [Clostridia bacterium]